MIAPLEKAWVDELTGWKGEAATAYPVAESSASRISA